MMNTYWSCLILPDDTLFYLIYNFFLIISLQCLICHDYRLYNEANTSMDMQTNISKQSQLLNARLLI